jgi:hypothetical protein
MSRERQICKREVKMEVCHYQLVSKFLGLTKEISEQGSVRIEMECETLKIEICMRGELLSSTHHG